MDWLNILATLLEVIETTALIGAMMFMTRAMREKNDEAARKSALAKGLIFLGLFLVLNIVTNRYF